MKTFTEDLLLILYLYRGNMGVTERDNYNITTTMTFTDTI